MNSNHKRKTLRGVITIVMVALLSTSCVSKLATKIEVEGYDNLKINGLSSIEIDLEISNSSRRNLQLSDVEITLNRNQKMIGTLVLSETLTIDKRSENKAYPTKWNIRNVNALAALSASKELLSKEPSKAFTVDVQATIKAGRPSYKFSGEGIEISQITQLIEGKEKIK